MSQLNLKKILSSNDISTLVDILNYNFDQIVLNGGGPQGLRGLIGAPGLPGLQGVEGETGPTGIDGTYIYSSLSGPNVYEFGASGSGENFPRANDIFIEIRPDLNSLVLWQNENVGSTTQWFVTGTVTAPGGANKLIYDLGAGVGQPPKTSISNDPDIAGKAFFGDVEAFDSSRGIINPLDSSRFTGDFSESLPIIHGQSVLTLAGNKNQIRMFCSDSALDPSNMLTSGGGILHTLEVDSGKQWYKIINGDSIGQKSLLINLHDNPGEFMLIGGTAGKIVLGGVMGDEISTKARLTVNKSLIVGEATFYNSASFSSNLGIISQGNLVVGKYPTNGFASGGFWSRTGGGLARVFIGTETSAAVRNCRSELVLGLNIGPVGSSATYSSFSILTDGNPNSDLYRGFLLKQDANLGFGATSLNHLFVRAFQILNSENPTTVGIGNTDPFSLLEIGSGESRVSSGVVPGKTTGKISSFISFNCSRLPQNQSPFHEGLWLRRYGLTAGGNGGSVLWSNNRGTFNFSVFPTLSTIAVRVIDQDVYEATKLTLTANSTLVLTDGNASSVASTLDNGLLWVNFAATGTLSAPTGTLSALSGRRINALFGPIGPSKKGTPIICDTNGNIQGTIIQPQFTFWNSDRFGMYLGTGSTANASGSDTSIGLAYSGDPAVHASRSRLGIYTNNPHERVQIGEKLVIHDGGSKFYGYNIYYGLTGSPGSPAQEGLYPISSGGSSIWGIGSEDNLPFTLYQGFANLGGYHTWESFSTSGGLTTRFVNNDSYTATATRMTFLNRGAGGIVEDFYKYDHLNYAPKLLIGFDNIYDIDLTDWKFIRRGTLSLVAQKSQYSSTVVFPNPRYDVDDYALSLYDYRAKPVLGIAPSSVDITNFYYQPELKFRLLVPSDERNSDGIGKVSRDRLFMRVNKRYDYGYHDWAYDEPGHIWIGNKSDRIVLGDDNLGLTSSYTLRVVGEPIDNNAAQFGGNARIEGEFSCYTTDMIGAVITQVGPFDIEAGAYSIIPPIETDRLVYITLYTNSSIASSNIWIGDGSSWNLMFGSLIVSASTPITIAQKKGWSIRINNTHHINSLSCRYVGQSFGTSMT